MDCRFCNIEINQPGRTLVMSLHTVVIFSDPRLMPGHLLVIPKRHVLGLNELNEEERKELFNTAIEYQRRIMERVAGGCDIRQHNRPFLPENDLKVDHVHIHLQPREFDDELYLKSEIHSRDLFKTVTQEEINKFKDLLK